MKKIPKLTRHSRGLGVVRLNGSDYYSTPHRWPKSAKFPPASVVQWYNALIAEWKASYGMVRSKSPTINVVVSAFLENAQGKYRERRHDETDEISNFRYSVKAMLGLYGTLAAEEFSPRKLKAVRQKLIDDGLTRRSINSRIRRIKQIFAWAVEEELIPGGVHHSLAAVKGLRKGKSEAKEKPRIKPAKFADIKAVIVKSRPEIAAMIRLQLYTGMRPGEVCKITPAQIDRSRKVWVYRPTTHKTSDHEDDSREIYIGKKAQSILLPWLPSDPEKPCFRTSPSRTGRRNQYTTHNYQQYVERICKRLKVTRWSPNQLRHNAGTRFRRRYGLEVARVLLGHKKVETTQIYAEQNKRKAFKAMKKLG